VVSLVNPSKRELDRDGERKPLRRAWERMCAAWGVGVVTITVPRQRVGGVTASIGAGLFVRRGVAVAAGGVV